MLAIRHHLAETVARWLRETQELDVWMVLSYSTEVVEGTCPHHVFKTLVSYTNGTTRDVKTFVYSGSLEELLDEL